MFQAASGTTIDKQTAQEFLAAANQVLLFNGEIKDCIAKTDQIRVLDKTRLEKRLGRLSDTAIASVGLGLEYLFDL